MFNSQNNPGRQVQIDEATLIRLANLAGIPLENLNQGQLMPRQASVPSEYVIPSENVIADEKVIRYPDDAVEMDLNQNRNKIVDETFHYSIIR